jgi:hypothetical protein
MKSTPARELRKGQLLIEQYAVHKITDVDYAIPENVLVVTLSNQIDRSARQRTLRWHEQVATEEGLEVKIGNRGTIRVELAQLKDPDDRPRYRWLIKDPDSYLVDEGVDLSLGASRRPSNKEAIGALLSFLGAAAEGYEVTMRGGESENATLFANPRTTEWAYLMSDELQAAQLDLSGELGL